MLGQPNPLEENQLGQQPGPQPQPGVLQTTAAKPPEAPQPTGGLLSGQFRATAAPTATATTTSAPAADPSVLPDPASVEKRVSGLLGRNSDYLKSAQTNAMQAANRRGLLNSSIASQAGAKAAIDSVLPIAQQDAQQSGRFAENDRNFGYQTQLQTQQDNAQLDRIREDAAQRSSLAEQDFGYRQALQTMDETNRLRLQELENRNRALLQQSGAAAQRFTDLSQQMAAITTNEKLTPEQKSAAINNLVGFMNSSLKLQNELAKAAGVDNVDFLSPGDPGATGDPAGGATEGTEGAPAGGTTADPRLEFLQASNVPGSKYATGMSEDGTTMTYDVNSYVQAQSAFERATLEAAKAARTGSRTKFGGASYSYPMGYDAWVATRNAVDAARKDLDAVIAGFRG